VHCLCPCTADMLQIRCSLTWQTTIPWWLVQASATLGAYSFRGLGLQASPCNNASRGWLGSITCMFSLLCVVHGRVPGCKCMVQVMFTNTHTISPFHPHSLLSRHFSSSLVRCIAVTRGAAYEDGRSREGCIAHKHLPASAHLHPDLEPSVWLMWL
jgi:hypothetical protein